MIASSSSRNSSKNMPRFSSNDMVHNHYLDVAKKKIQERDRNSTTSVTTSTRIQTTADDSKPKPRSNNQTSRSLPISKSSRVTITVVTKADHSKRKIFDSCTSKVDSKPPHGSNVDILNIHECKQTLDVSAGTSINVQKEQSLDLSACTLCNVNKENLRIKPRTSMLNDVCTTRFKPRTTMSTEVHQAAETVTTSNELDLLFGPLFDEYFNGENQVVSKSFAVTTTDASNKRQQQPDSTSFTLTLATTVTANGNFDFETDVRVNDIARKLIAAQEIDFLFKVNFLTLFMNTMGKADGLKGQICLDVVRRLREDSVISDIDWCGYIYDCLRDSKLPGRTNHYLGPLTFLIGRMPTKIELTLEQSQQGVSNDVLIVAIEIGGSPAPASDTKTKSAQIEEDPTLCELETLSRKILLNLPYHRFRRRCSSLIQAKSDIINHIPYSSVQSQSFKGMGDNVKIVDSNLPNYQRASKSNKESSNGGEIFILIITMSKQEWHVGVQSTSYNIGDDDDEREWDDDEGDKMVIQSKSHEIHSESHVIYSESHVIHSESYVIHFESHDVFEAHFGKFIIYGVRLNLETLALGLWLDANVIGCWGTVLNHEESFRAAESKSKHFFPTGCIKKLFARHLKQYGHIRHTQVARVKQTIPKLKWKTKENFHDCGIFTMLHMETFDGGPASNLDCGLPVESQLQRDMLRRLRFKFATKILLHEINVHAGKMLELAKEFDKTDPVEKMAIIVDAFKKREERDCI
ncbi:uncharacterized mitochondrial protein-like protein [Tanacetum coccineum]